MQVKENFRVKIKYVSKKIGFINKVNNFAIIV